MGRQPFGLASPAAWLERAGHEVVCADLSIDSFPEAAVRKAETIAFYLPMHTATRLAVPVIAKVKRLNPAARLCCFGLYAPLNETYLRSLGVETIIGGEFEAAVTAMADGGGSLVPLDRLQFIQPLRSGLPPIAKYAHLHVNGREKIVGYTEASSRLQTSLPSLSDRSGLQRDVFASCSRTSCLKIFASRWRRAPQHITFGDPDFFNGPTPRHADRRGAARRISGPHLRRHHQGRTPAPAAASS